MSTEMLKMETKEKEKFLERHSLFARQTASLVECLSKSFKIIGSEVFLYICDED